jgi:hypothetical protein
MRRKRVHTVTVVLTLAVVLFVVFLVYSNRLEPTGEQQLRMMPMEPVPEHDDRLGVLWKPYPQVINPGDEKNVIGIQVLGFRPPPAPPPLLLVGIKPGDTILECNGEKADVFNIDGAIRALREKGEPMTLLVTKEWGEVTLKIDEWPPPGAPQVGGARKPETGEE